MFRDRPPPPQPLDYCSYGEEGSLAFRPTILEGSSPPERLRVKNAVLSRAREAARKTRLLNLSVVLLSAFLAVAMQGTFDDVKRIYLQDASPHYLMWIESLVWIFIIVVIWYIYGVLSVDDDKRAEYEYLHHGQNMMHEKMSYLMGQMEEMLDRQSDTREAFSRATNGTGHL